MDSKNKALLTILIMKYGQGSDQFNIVLWCNLESLVSEVVLHTNGHDSSSIALCGEVNWTPNSHPTMYCANYLATDKMYKF